LYVTFIPKEKKDKKDKYPKHVPYSFWKWFLGVFNVIEEFLLKYWNDGLVHIRFLSIHVFLIAFCIFNILTFDSESHYPMIYLIYLTDALIMTIL
jgi:hypothetical protein